MVTTVAAAATITFASPAQAASHKAPFDCGKRFYANNWSPGHSPSGSIDWQTISDGIDGENVRATAAGTARFFDAGSTSYGKWVEITHNDGTRTRYAHMSSMVRSPGQSMAVSQGTKIGVVGSTGGATGPHLHYEQRNASGVVDTSPTVDGVTVPLGSKIAITSSNTCAGNTNPYTPEEVCGSAFDVIDSAALGTVGKVFLLYNASNGNNCVVTLKYTSVGTPSAVSAFLEPQGSTRTTDSGSFSYYAGPVKRSAPGTCVRWGGSVGGTAYTSPFEHCG
jgi:hypothetical protein